MARFDVLDGFLRIFPAELNYQSELSLYVRDTP